MVIIHERRRLSCFHQKEFSCRQTFLIYSDEALKQALELAKQYNAKVYLHACREPDYTMRWGLLLRCMAVKKAEDAEILPARK
jgi:hypothetical protein